MTKITLYQAFSYHFKVIESIVQTDVNKFEIKAKFNTENQTLFKELYKMGFCKPKDEVRIASSNRACSDTWMHQAFIIKFDSFKFQEFPFPSIL